MPIPSARNEVLERRILGQRLELAANFLGDCCQDGSVTETPRTQGVHVIREESIHLGRLGWGAPPSEERLPLGSVFGRDKLSH